MLEIEFAFKYNSFRPYACSFLSASMLWNIARSMSSLGTYVANYICAICLIWHKWLRHCLNYFVIVSARRSHSSRLKQRLTIPKNIYE